MEQIKDHPSMFGGAPMSFSKDDHLGPDKRNSAILSKVVGPKWQKLQNISY
jgi:hypothetical protein